MRNHTNLDEILFDKENYYYNLYTYSTRDISNKEKETNKN